MKNLSLVSKRGAQYSVKLPEGRPGTAANFVFAFAKSGSTLADRMVRNYCAQIRVPTFSLFGSAFEQGIAPIDILSDARPSLEIEGCVYTGFRHYPKNFEIDLSRAKSILLVRDPRDMLVSLYYSVAKSHKPLKGSAEFLEERDRALNSDINAFVLQYADGYLQSFHRYQDKLDSVAHKIYRYEDVIYKKVAWLGDIIDYFELAHDEELIQEIASKYDEIPDKEDPASHVRQVHPGNYKEKLHAETIAQLNLVFGEFLEVYKYEVS